MPEPKPRPEAAPAEASETHAALGEADRLLRRLEWKVLRRLDGLLEGDYRTLFRGQGLDLADLREYQFHDDVRYIDWNVTARIQVPHVREFQQDRDINVWFLLDLSGSVHFGAGEFSKRDLLIAFVALMSRLLTRHGNRVGAIVCGDTVDTVIPARSGRQQVLQLVHRLLSRPARPAGRPARAQGETDLAQLFHRAGSMMRRRSLVFVVSDFIAAPGWTEPLGQLVQRHEVLAVRLTDPLEESLPDLGLVMFEDAETGEQQLVDTHDPGFRRRFEQAAQDREARLRLAFGDAGVDVLELATDEDLVVAVRRFVELRKLRARLSAGGGAIQSRPPAALASAAPL
jgi:uncharacterized protein (DUF58 family)